MDVGASLPLLVAFGLDQTLWPFNLYSEEAEFIPPFRKYRTGEVVDSNGRSILYYSDVPTILQKLEKARSKIALVAFKGDYNVSLELISAFGWDKYVSYKETYPGDIKTHFQKLHEKSGVSYSDMMYFDDPYRFTLDEVSSLGVYSAAVPPYEGLTEELFELHVHEFNVKKTENG